MKMNTIYFLDKRSIALFRITLGLVLIYNFIVYKLIPAGEYLLPETGLIGNEYKQIFISRQLWSPFDFMTTDIQFYIVSAITLFVFLLLTIGCFTRGISIAAYLLFLSFQQRYYPLEMGWDKYINVMLFISMLLPLNHFFSVDKILFKKKFRDNQVEYRHPFAMVMLMQIGVIYFFSGIVKNGNLWLTGDAVKVAVNDFLQHTFLTEYLLKSDMLLKVLNYYTVAFEILLFFILFFPYKNKQLRYAVICIIISFHWGVSLFLNVGHFKWISLATCAVLLPDTFWMYLSKLKSGLKRYILPESRTEQSELHKVQWYLAVILSTYLVTFMVHNGFRKLAFRGGGISEYMQSLGIGEVLENTVFYPSGFLLSSYFNQSWFFYAPNPPELSGVYALSGKLDGREYTINHITNHPQSDLRKSYYHSQLDMFFQEKLSLYSLQLNNFEQTSRMYQELNRLWMMNRYQSWKEENPSVRLEGLELKYIYYNRNNEMFFDVKDWNIYLVESVEFSW